MPHYGTLIPPFARVYLGNEADRLADVLSFTEEERPILVVGVMRDNTPELIPLWGPARHFDPPYACTELSMMLMSFSAGTLSRGTCRHPPPSMGNGSWRRILSFSPKLCSNRSWRIAHWGADLIPELAADLRWMLTLPKPP
jgi:hypothetical protein